MKVHFVLLSTGLIFGSSFMSVAAPVKGGCDARDGITSTCSESDKAFEEQLDLFDKTMEPGYLDQALSIVKEVPDRDGENKILRNARSKKLNAMFLLFRAATDSINVRYVPQMELLLGIEDKRVDSQYGAIPSKVASPYLYDYIQSGLRIFRFQLRLEILDYISSSYIGVPSPEERDELLSAAQGVSSEFLNLLGDWMKVDVSWKLNERQKIPHRKGEGDQDLRLS